MRYYIQKKEKEAEQVNKDVYLSFQRQAGFMVFEDNVMCFYDYYNEIRGWYEYDEWV